MTLPGNPTSIQRKIQVFAIGQFLCEDYQGALDAIVSADDPVTALVELSLGDFENLIVYEPFEHETRDELTDLIEDFYELVADLVDDLVKSGDLVEP